MKTIQSKRKRAEIHRLLLKSVKDFKNAERNHKRSSDKLNGYRKRF